MRTRAVVAAVAVAALVGAGMGAGGAFAQSAPGVYVGAMGGGNYLEDMQAEFIGGGLLGAIDLDVSHDWGWGAGATVGFRHGDGVRTEFEASYRTNQADELNVFGVNIPFDGDINTYSTMLNILYDFEFDSMVVPYIGVGLGAAYVEADDIDFDNPPLAGGPSFNDSDWAFAYQGIAGVNLRVSEHIDVFADYRYFSTMDLNLRDSGYPPIGPGTKSDDDYTSHTLMAGLRYTFTSVVVPEGGLVPPPAAGEPIPRQYLIFFDWDSDALSAEAQGVVADAAGYALSGGIAQIVVTGHTDSSGSQSYNVGLSKRRAENTAVELQAHGVDPATIAVNWKGETEPLVATGDGVREPQNRRAEIVFP